MITIDGIRGIASRFEIPALRIEITALQAGIIPLRYLSNIGTLGIPGQLELLRSCVGICGLGGLGGYVVELLARIGVGHLILADGDIFEEDNLNRQNLCTESSLGRLKAEEAAERVRVINSSLRVAAHSRFVAGGDVREIYGETDLVVDALDTVSARFALEAGCTELGIPMVHGAIAGDSGQVMTIFPGDPGLKIIYSSGDDRGVETIEGNPSTTPALVASVQATEAVKIICGGEPLRRGFLLIDTSSNLYQFIPLE
ncbi:MAG: HesA/MoeB/ThiF family protein [Actinomycetota bacterium]|nr:HesA/MoeB/ThiF family protein [Actinomycetota bacterium]